MYVICDTRGFFFINGSSVNRFRVKVDDKQNMYMLLCEVKMLCNDTGYSTPPLRLPVRRIAVFIFRPASPGVYGGADKEC